MAVLKVTNTEWSAPVLLTADEIWQVREGDVLIASWEPSGPVDGFLLSGHSNDAVQFKAGQSVRYRAVNVFNYAILVHGES